MTHLFKKIAVASAVALAFGGTSLSANAAVETIGLGTTSFDTTFNSNGAFTTFYNFVVVPNAGSMLSQSSLYLKSFNSGVLLNSLALYIGNYSTSGDLSGKSVYAADSYTNTGGGIQFPFLGASTTLSAGTTYTLVTKGTIYGASANIPISYNTQFLLAAVPEPETYAMMLAGTGVMGFIARRRKANKQA